MEPDVPETRVQRSDVSPRAHTGNMGEVFPALHLSFLLKPNGSSQIPKAVSLVSEDSIVEETQAAVKRH